MSKGLFSLAMRCEKLSWVVWRKTVRCLVKTTTKRTLSLLFLLKQLYILFYFHPFGKAESQKQGPGYYENCTTWKQLLLQKQFLILPVLLALCFSTVEALSRSWTKHNLSGRYIPFVFTSKKFEINSWDPKWIKMKKGFNLKVVDILEYSNFGFYHSSIGGHLKFLNFKIWEIQT